MTRYTVDACVTRAKEEIARDVRAGLLPAEVASFADLHDHVDANEYGGLCEPECLDVDTDGSLACQVQDRLHRWLVAGGLALALVGCVPTPGEAGTYTCSCDQPDCPEVLDTTPPGPAWVTAVDSIGVWVSVPVRTDSRCRLHLDPDLCDAYPAGTDIVIEWAEATDTDSCWFDTGRAL